MEYLLTLSNYFREFFLTGLLGILIFFTINIGNKYVDEKKQFKITKKQIIYFMIILTVVYTFFKIYTSSNIISELFSIFFISIIIAYLLNPLVNYLEEKGLSRLWGVLLVYFVLIGSIIVIFISILPSIVEELKNLIAVLPTYFNSINEFFNDFSKIYSDNIDNLPVQFQSLKESFNENLSSLQNIVTQGFKNIGKSTINMFSKAFNLFIIPIVSFYFIKDKEYFKKKICLLIPKKYRNDTLKISREIDNSLGKFVRGQLIVASFVGIATAIGLLILGINYALTIGLLAGVANIIPYFGPIIGIIPAVTFALLEEPIKALWVVLLFLIIQQIEGNILSPKIVGESVGLHPVAVILSLLVGGSLMGIIGMLLAVPIVTVLRIIIRFIIDKLTEI
ncbi:MAG: AI-2E family transporter [Firmicutes bacterium]|nr:AI-2E family transporter [Bacillota bacterium]